MKKLILTNTIVVVIFILFDLLLDYLDKWSDTYSLGAEIVLGLMTHPIFAFFPFFDVVLNALFGHSMYYKERYKTTYSKRNLCYSDCGLYTDF